MVTVHYQDTADEIVDVILEQIDKALKKKPATASGNVKGMFGSRRWVVYSLYRNKN